MSICHRGHKDSEDNTTPGGKCRKCRNSSYARLMKACYHPPKSNERDKYSALRELSDYMTEDERANLIELRDGLQLLTRYI